MATTVVGKAAGDHAVVLGASMAGLLAARVLSEIYGRVTVIDRDALPEIGAHRRGVPQGRHNHGLYPRGREVLDELFPGFTTDVVEAGAELEDTLDTIRVMLSGHRLCQADIGLPAALVSELDKLVSVCSAGGPVLARTDVPVQAHP